MQNAVIIDLVLAAILLASLFIGVRRGLYRSLAGCLAVVLAIVGSIWLTEICSPGVIETVRPVLREQVEERVSAAIDERLAEAGEQFSVGEILDILGLGESLTEGIREALEKTGNEAVNAITDDLLESIVPTVLKILFFLILLLVFKLLLPLFQPLFQLPVLQQLNQIGGGLLGLAEGTILLFVLLWLLCGVGVLSFSQETLDATFLLKWFLN